MSKYNLSKGRVYRVRLRSWDNKPGRTVRRFFLGEEQRFTDIGCYLFSSQIRKGQAQTSLVSIPKYDIISIVEDCNG